MISWWDNQVGHQKKKRLKKNQNELSILPDYFTGSPNSAGVRWDFEFIGECMKVNKIHPAFHFLTIHRLGLKGQCSFSMKNPPRVTTFVFEDVTQSMSTYETHQSAIVLGCYMSGSSLLLLPYWKTRRPWGWGWPGPERWIVQFHASKL